jgi:hypothetical protein
MSAALEASSYPINVSIDPPTNPKRFWAVPLLGLFVREILLIPHIVVLAVLGLVISVCSLFLWIPVLFKGQLPDFGYKLISGFIRSQTRIGAYFLGLTDTYPPFGDGTNAALPEVTFERSESASRFWAIPLVGLVVKEIILIPHVVALGVLTTVAELLMLISWAPVLFSGTYPTWAYGLFSGVLRWNARMWAYFFGLTDKYPPFSLS